MARSHPTVRLGVALTLLCCLGSAAASGRVLSQAVPGASGPGSDAAAAQEAGAPAGPRFFPCTNYVTETQCDGALASDGTCAWVDFWGCQRSGPLPPAPAGGAGAVEALPEVNCPTDLATCHQPPCSVAACTGYPQAVCVANACPVAVEYMDATLTNTCQPVYVDRTSMTIVSCNVKELPEGIEMEDASTADDPMGAGAEEPEETEPAASPGSDAALGEAMEEPEDTTTEPVETTITMEEPAADADTTTITTEEPADAASTTVTVGEPVDAAATGNDPVDATVVVAEDDATIPATTGGDAAEPVTRAMFDGTADTAPE